MRFFFLATPTALSGAATVRFNLSEEERSEEAAEQNPKQPSGWLCEEFSFQNGPTRLHFAKFNQAFSAHYKRYLLQTSALLHLVYDAVLEVATEDLGLLCLILSELPGPPTKILVHVGHEDGRCTSLILGGVIACAAQTNVSTH